MATAPARIQLPPSDGNRLRERQTQVTNYLAKTPISHLVTTLTRNKNQNFVCYAAQLQGAHFHPTEPLQVFWMDIEPSYQRANRAKGKLTDREELGWFERKMAFGVTVARRGGTAAAPTEFAVNFVAVPKHTFVLRVVDGQARLMGTTLKGERFVLQRLHADEVPRALGVPSVRSVTLVGNNVANGALVMDVVSEK